MFVQKLEHKKKRKRKSIIITHIRNVLKIPRLKTKFVIPGKLVAPLECSPGATVKYPGTAVKGGSML